MKIINNTLIIFLFFIFFSNTYAYASVINKSVSEKYFDIFSESILSIKDVENYKKIIQFQEVCSWKQANKYILKLENKILMGHVLAQRYLHPKCYRSQFIELSNWLKLYNDHPQAKRIYRLAIKRMPQGYKRPPTPSKVIGINESNIKIEVVPAYISKLKLTKNQQKEKGRLLNAIKSRVNKGWPTGAAKLLNQRDVKILLDQVEIDQQKELIAKGYFLFNKNELAIKYASEALNKSFIYVPYANWTAGLSAWRLKDYKLASKFFSDFSISLKDDVWHQASGSFWTARAYAELNQYEEINFWLSRAARNPNSFYGMLSSNILGIKEPIDWSKEKLNIQTKKKISSIPSGTRIQALIQVGLLEELENEIVKINSVMNSEVALWSLNIAQYFNLAYTQLKIARKLSKYNVDLPVKFFYPLPIWQLEGGYQIDSALMYAFMHQESMFNTAAKSHRGAIGLMQIMPSTAKFISSNKKINSNNLDVLKNPQTNLQIGQKYIQYLMNLKNINGNLIYLAAAYNGGPGNLKKWLENTNYQGDSLLFMESIPSRETRWFIEKVLTKYWIYKNQLGESPNSLEMLANGKNPIY